MTKPAKEKIDVLILSDIHLGDSSLRCGELLEILKRYDAKKIILNGDILDGLKFRRLSSDHWNVLSTFRKLSKIRDVIWVHGNHDAENEIISRLLGIKSVNRYLWKINGTKYLALHGHQFDRFLNNNFISSQIVFFLYSQLKKNKFGRFVLKYIKNNNQTWRRNSSEVSSGAMRLARMKNVSYVFCGHTHQVFENEENGIKYFNTGTWTETPSAFVTINNHKVTLHKI